MKNSPITVKQIAIVFIAFVLINAIFLTGYFIGDSNGVKRAGQNSANEASQKTQLTNVTATHNTIDVNLLWQVWDKINSAYLVKDLDNKKLFYSSIKGLVSGLDDPYTNFLTPEEVNGYNESNKGEFEGIGVTLRQEGQYTVIESVIDGFPAANNGLLSNDMILKVDGNDISSKSVNEVATLIRGKSDTKVKLGIYRASTKKDFEVEITRKKIDIDNISLGDYKDGIQTIKIYKFTESSPEEFNKMWDAVADKVQKVNPKGIIIDLRGNPGGYVSGVEYILGDFVAKGKVVFYEEDRAGNRQEHVVSRDGRFLNTPLVVLVNSGSASASEIMTGALQDYKRATVIGEKTVGKGVEQELINFDDGSQLQLVFRKWLTPKGNNINKQSPLTPDIIIEDYQAQNAKALEILNK